MPKATVLTAAILCRLRERPNDFAAGFMTIVPAEILAARDGIGAILQQASLMGQVDRIFVALALIATLGLLSDLTVRLISRRLLGRYTAYLAKM